MSRSLALATGLSLFSLSLAGCAAQEDRRNLQGSITRLEQRLERMDEYMKSMQTGQAQQKQERNQALEQAQAELKRLRDLLAAHEQETNQTRRQSEEAQAQLQGLRRELEAMRDHAQHANLEAQKKSQEQSRLAADLTVARKAAEEQNQKTQEQRRRAEELEAAVKQQQNRDRAELAELRSKLADAQRDHEQRQANLTKRAQSIGAELEAARAELKKAEASKAQEGAELARERNRAIEKLGAERREIEQLREAVARDLATTKQRTEGKQAEAIAKLQQENEALRSTLAKLERDRATAATKPPAPPMLLSTTPGPNPPAGLGLAARATKPPAADGAAPGTIVVNNGSGEVHFHFHGTPPKLTVTHDGQPPRATSTEPTRSIAAPVEVRRLQDAPPAIDTKAPAPVDALPRKKKAKDDDEGRKIHGPEVEALPLANFVQALLGSF